MSGAKETFMVKREYGARGICAVCKEVVFDETYVTDDSGNYVAVVQGSYTQATDKDGNYIGPKLPFCPEHTKRVK